MQTIERDQIESNLNFLGLLVMENKMKPVTKEVIQNLQECEVGTIMATGDNVLTAISVAKQCNIIPARGTVFLGDVATD